jgi:hypothetical protein
MPAKRASGFSVETVEQKLPRTFFVRRGHIRDAFGLTEEEMSAFVPGVFKPKYLPTNGRGKTTRAHFVRTQVISVARQWEAA